MNKRQKKKLQKRIDFAEQNGYGITYQNKKLIDRSYHEYVIECEREQRYRKLHGIKEDIWDILCRKGM